MLQGKGLHHFHIRKRIHENLEPYPHPDKLKNLIDRLVYAVGIFGPLITIPQILTIWVEKNAEGVSLISWTGYFFVAVFWLIYGLTHKEKPIIFTYSLLSVMNFLVMLGIILYS